MINSSEDELRRELAEHTEINKWWSAMRLSTKVEIMLHATGAKRMPEQAKAAPKEESHPTPDYSRAVPDDFPMEAGIGIKGDKVGKEKKK